MQANDGSIAAIVHVIKSLDKISELMERSKENGKHFKQIKILNNNSALKGQRERI